MHVRAPLASPGLLDCRDLLKSTFDTLERVVGDNVELVLQLPSTPALVAASPDELVDIVVSLLNLSCDSLGALDRDRARVVARVRDSALVNIEIGDNGPGFAGEELSAAFLGRRGPGSPPSAVSAALADCSHRIARLGGQFQIESRVGEGTRYTVSLPSAADEPTAP